MYSLFSRKITKKTRKQRSTKNITKNITKTIKTTKSKDINIFNNANSIFNDIDILKQKISDNKEHFWIITDKYNDELNFKSNLSDSKIELFFLLYCMMRFNNWKYQDLIQLYTTYPANFPMRGYFSSTNTYNNHNSFNYMLFLNSFIYQLLETKQSLHDFIKHSKPIRWGFNINEIKLNDILYYNIYYTTHHIDISKTKILISVNYTSEIINKYLDVVNKFINSNMTYFKEHKYLTDVYIFYNTHEFDFKNKFISVNKLYIPKCHIELNEQVADSVLAKLFYKDVNYPNYKRVDKLVSVFKKYRNINQLQIDLKKQHITNNNFNQMIRGIKPLCFASKIQYRKFIHELAILLSSKLKNFTIRCLGSATTFYSSSPVKEKLDKMYTEKSDLDIGIIINENMDNLLPELENTYTQKFLFESGGMYGNFITRNLFDKQMFDSFFNKWGKQEFADIELEELAKENYKHTDINKTILKRGISLVIYKKENLFDYFDDIKKNKTILTHFMTFVNDGQTIGYWNENNKFIEEDL